MIAEINAVGFVAAGWLIVAGSFGLFALTTIRRERRLHKSLPPEERRWS